ncbi:MAG: hypothetical protein ACI8V5_000202 [Limisphaerales bacterium]|jgi:hypothetical protein
MALPEPFGGLLLLAAFAVSFIVGLFVAIAGRESKKRVFTGIGIIAAPWILLALLAILSPGIDEWNPTLDADSAAWGTWEGDGYLIELKSDSSYAAKLKDESRSGTWRRMDWNVYLANADGQERYMRFVEDSGGLLLLPDPPRDDSLSTGPITRKR